MSQLSLFSSKSTIDSVQDRPKKPIPVPSRRFDQRKVPEPYGSPDKRGKYAYERFEYKASKLSQKSKEKFLDIWQTSGADVLEDIIVLGEFWRKCTPLECDDIARSYGF